MTQRIERHFFDDIPGAIPGTIIHHHDGIALFEHRPKR